jgi:hypothetical protein
LIDAIIDLLIDEAEHHDSTLNTANFQRVKQSFLTEPEFLPGFSVALNMILGQVSITEYETRSERIAAPLAYEKGDAFTWQDVYADKEANGFPRSSILISRRLKTKTQKIP